MAEEIRAVNDNSTDYESGEKVDFRRKCENG